MKKSYIISAVFILTFFCIGMAFSDDRKDASGKGDQKKPQYYQDDQDRQKTSGQPGHRADEKQPGKPGYRNGDERSKDRVYRDDEKRKDTYRRDRDRKSRDFKGHDGYRERPYERNRRYDRHDYKGRRYEYEGHWRSWDQWERYAKDHPDIRKNGDYYRENTHLMFRFCEPGTGACFFFSIGK